ncbi:hypothetical protein JTB14_015133 [Gonioctena quinquepunctata]|nr:hypothetical protein JTB14_015133 [Gonioctena quinquepunctata]
MDLLEFGLSLGEYLVAGTKKRVLKETDGEDNSENDINQGNKIKKRREAASLSCVDKRLDGFEHWPTNEDMKNPVKCRLSQSRSLKKTTVSSAKTGYITRTSSSSGVRTWSNGTIDSARFVSSSLGTFNAPIKALSSASMSLGWVGVEVGGYSSSGSTSSS